jgi:hypothetical protein
VPRISREYERFAFARESKRTSSRARRRASTPATAADARTAVAMRALMVGVLGVAVLRLSDRLRPAKTPTCSPPTC